MEIPFYKYHGAGNDFILLNQTQIQYLDRSDTDLIAALCHRRFGIGADGLILLQNKEGYDFEMIYFNADGRESSMCGNGGRCIVAFAKDLGIVDDNCTFWAIDGEHEAFINAEGNWVELKMIDVPTIQQKGHDYVLNTGSPHYIQFVEHLTDINIAQQGAAIRNSPDYKAEGINVNFVEINSDNELLIGTYERGVEDETLACGTGITAAALAFCLKSKTEQEEIHVKAKGGNLSVRMKPDGNSGFEAIWLCGPAALVFEGKYTTTR